MNDDNRKMILAMVLSALVLFGWYLVFPPPAQAPAPVTTTQQTVTPEPSVAPQAVSVPNTPVVEAGRIDVDTPSLSGSISLAGGRVDDLLLKNYHQDVEKTSPLVRLLRPTSEAGKGGAYYAVYGWLAGEGTDAALVPNANTIWAVESGTTLTPTAPVTIKWDNGAGQIFRRTFAIDDKFLFTVTQSIENTAQTPFSAAPYGIIARVGTPATQGYYVLHEGVVGMADGSLLEKNYKNITKLKSLPGEGQAELFDIKTDGWIGFTDKYWMTTLAPAAGQAFTAAVKYNAADDTYQTITRLPMETVAAGTTAQSQTYLFAGAKEWETIKAYETSPGITRFVDSIDWGWFYFLTKPIFRILHFLHGMIGNMGWSIIALTIFLKLLLFPLARKSYVSMARMRELQPEMEAIKERTGDDRMKYQQEVMALYKREKVNPAAGCLPLLLQIPIFFSLYKVIFVTLELRHAPWIGWIRDLSAPDPSSILNLFGLLDFTPPSSLHLISLGVLPIILGISMWLQQKLNPAPTDPAQKMIFAWMPWIFMFMLGSFPAGLVLYWITNNTITILQQYTIMSLHGHPPDIFGNIRGNTAAKSDKK